MRRFVTCLVVASIFVGSFGLAYALGSQNHTTNTIKHGCPFDFGCAGTTQADEGGDFIRHGYNRCGDSGCSGNNDMNFSRVRVVRISNDQIEATNTCNNCFRVDVTFDTNPAKECKFFTRHYSENPDLDQHAHYTESALC